MTTTEPSRTSAATVFGTLATAVVYMLSLIAVFGILPSSTLAGSTAPFSGAVNSVFGGTVWSKVMAVIVIISGFGGLSARFARDMTIAGLSVVFSILFIWYPRNTGNSFWVCWAPFFMAGGALLLGIPVYLAQRHRMTQPESVPAEHLPTGPAASNRTC